MRATHEVEIHTPPEDVWRVLADPDWTFLWYHGTRVVIASQYRRHAIARRLL